MGFHEAGVDLTPLVHNLALAPKHAGFDKACGTHDELNPPIDVLTLTLTPTLTLTLTLT